MLKRVGESRHPCQTPTVVRNQSAVRVDCTNGLVTEVFDNSDKVGGDVVLPRGCPQSCMSNPVEGLLEVYEDMVDVLPVLEIFLTEDSWVENLPCGAPSSAVIFSACGFNLFSIILSMTLLGWLMRLIVG